MEVIPWHLILSAAAVTAAAVALAALLVRWGPPMVGAAAAGAFVLILGWRAIANGAQWNDDFVRLVSIGDVGCLIAGAAGPALLLRTGRAVPRSLVPAVVGGLVGFVVNVVIL